MSSSPDPYSRSQVSGVSKGHSLNVVMGPTAILCYRTGGFQIYCACLSAFGSRLSRPFQVCRDECLRQRLMTSGGFWRQNVQQGFLGLRREGADPVPLNLRCAITAGALLGKVFRLCFQFPFRAFEARSSLNLDLDISLRLENAQWNLLIIWRR